MIQRLYWFWKIPRLGPDILTTHFLLYFKKTARWICARKFKKFGAGSEFRPFAYAVETHRISIGNNVTIRSGTHLYSNDLQRGAITIEDDVAIGSGVHVYTDNHKYDDPGVPIQDQGYHYAPVRICKGAWIGAGAIILCGVTVGQNAVVGAGSVVTKDVPDYSVAVGVPAKVIKKVTRG